MSELDIAVVIVTYRTAGLTIKALNSLVPERAIPGLGIRAFVVDNASGDAAEISEAVQANGWSSWVSVIAAPRNGGFAYGNNLGVEHAYAGGAPAYIYLLNPDAQIRPGALKTLSGFMQDHPEVGIAGSGFENLDGSDWPIAFRFPGLISEFCQGLAVGLAARLLKRWDVPVTMSKQNQPVDWICGASMLIRPAVFGAIGGFDENYFLYFEETDFCYRASKAGFPTWYVPQSVVMHIAGQSTKVTGVPAGPKPLPGYWFESRRRYFIVTFGIGRAMAIDVATLLAHCIGWLKRVIVRETHPVPHFIRDLLRYSVLRARNRAVPAASCYAGKPPRAQSA